MMVFLMELIKQTGVGLQISKILEWSYKRTKQNVVSSILQLIIMEKLSGFKLKMKMVLKLMPKMDMPE